MSDRDEEVDEQLQVVGRAIAASMAASAPTATFNIQPPEPFDFSKPLEWTKWIRRFERFRQASNLTTNSEENQVNTLIYCMGDEADDVLKGLKLSDAEMKMYDKVKDGFSDFFIVKKNIVFERACFNMRKNKRLTSQLMHSSPHCILWQSIANTVTYKMNS